MICDDNSHVKVSTDESPPKLSAALEFKQLKLASTASCQQKVGSSSEWQRSSEGFSCVSKQHDVSSKTVRWLNKDWTRLGEDWSKAKGVYTINNDSAKSKPSGHSKWILNQTAQLETIRDAGVLHMLFIQLTCYKLTDDFWLLLYFPLSSQMRIIFAGQYTLFSSNVW